MASVLISRPIQARTQWELAKVRVVPNPRLNEKMERAKGLIQQRREFNQHIRGMGPRA